MREGFLIVLGLLVLGGCGGSGQGGGSAPPDGGSTDSSVDRSIHDAPTDTGNDIGMDSGDAGGDARIDGAVDAQPDTSAETGLPACADGGQGVVLASGQGSPFWIAIDSANVYWTNLEGGQVMECGIGDCCAHPITLATNQAYPSGVAVDSGNVYWINQGPTGPGTGSIATCPVNGCGGVATILSAGQGGDDMTAWGDLLFWSNNYSDPGPPVQGQFMTCTLSAGCMATTMPVDSREVSDAGMPIQPEGMAVDSTSVYWADYGVGWVLAANHNGTLMRTLATGQTLVRDVAIDATNVYWVTYEPLTVMQCAIAGCNDTPTALYVAASRTDTGNSIAVDATDVYVTTSQGILKCAIGGCNNQPTVLTSAQPANYYADIAVDGTSLYWTDARLGLVLMLPK